MMMMMIRFACLPACLLLLYPFAHLGSGQKNENEKTENLN